MFEVVFRLPSRPEKERRSLFFFFIIIFSLRAPEATHGAAATCHNLTALS